MKRVFGAFLLISVCTGSLWANGAPGISRVVAYDASLNKSEVVSNRQSQSQTIQPRTTVSRVVVPLDAETSNKKPVPGAVTRDVQNPESSLIPGQTQDLTNAPSASKESLEKSTISKRIAAASSEDSAYKTPSRAAISRSINQPSGRDALESAANNVGRNARTAAAGINNDPEVRRAGISLRPSTAEVGGRAIIAGTDVQTGSNINFNQNRSVQSRATKSNTTSESIAAAKERLEQTASLNKSCQEQYNDCMDQFCAVIDQNQKRCSCSANLARYSKSEDAVKEANKELNDVAQLIRYVGLSADEIRAIMSATEAETALSGKTDNTESRSMLDEIEKLIQNPTSANSYTSDDYFGLDLDIDFSVDSSDMFSLDFLNDSGSGFSNLRGRDLYNAAKKRCNSVLNQCKSAGATVQQVTGNYDLAIDKDCITYEQGLVKMNETLLKNVRSAKNMLDKARLAVYKNKNMYDARGCISALNTCMTDDMVCGDDYTKCLDPTKRYIDENGKVVLGQNIFNIIAFMEEYDNSKINVEFLKQSEALTAGTCDNEGKCVVKYLLSKIGTGATVRDGGLCRAVMDKCQYTTYTENVYNKYNEVVLNYVQRAMVNIKAAQQTTISEYASVCMMDIATCYNQQVSQVNTWSSGSNTTSVYNVMRGACRNVALTCAYAVFAHEDTFCPKGTSDADKNTCIDNISKIFYQSLLCPENSMYTETPGVAGEDNFVNDRCKCNPGFTPWNNICTRDCGPGTIRSNLTGLCENCKVGFYSKGKSPITGETPTSCTACPATTYTDVVGTSECKPCLENSYCPLASKEPVKCPDGKLVIAGQGGSLSDCK